MSGKMTKFKDLLVDTPNRYTVNGEVKTIVFSPNTITQEGTKDKAEYFNEMQKNGLYNVNAIRVVEGTVEFYDIAIEGSDIFDVFDTQFIINFNETNTKLNPILRFNGNNYYIRFIENFIDIDVQVGSLQKTYIGFLDSSNNKLKLIGYEKKLTFDTVADLQTATWLIEGDIVELLGYYTKGDGGGHRRKKNPVGSTYEWDYIANEGWYNVRWFGAKGDNIQYDDSFINEAFSRYTNVSIPEGKFKIKNTLIVPTKTSVQGKYRGSRIIADFTSGIWESTEYIAMRLSSKEGINLNNEDFNKNIDGISLSSIGASGCKSYGIMIRTENPDSASTVGTVNWSVYNAHISKIYIEKFDTAMDIRELWATDISKVMIFNCRVGIFINGQVVNCNFNNIQATIFTREFTNSTEKTIGFCTSPSNRYAGVLKNPEGIIMTESLIYGAENNLYIIAILALKIVNCIIDGGHKECVVIIDPNDLIIENCYLYTAHTTSILFMGLNAVQRGKISIINNNFVSSGNTIYGIMFEDVGVVRKNIDISENSFFDIKTGIYAGILPAMSNIMNNTGTGEQGEVFIEVLNGGENTIIDGNKIESSAPILRLQPITNSKLVIGKNFSKTYTTFNAGVSKIPAGSTSVVSNFGFGASENYIRPIVTFTSNLNTDIYFEPQIYWMDGTFRIPVALLEDLYIMYNVLSVPYSKYVLY